MLKLMYITNQPKIAKIADENGVDRIFVDLEKIGKQERQGGMDTVQSQHSIEDIVKVKKVLENAELLVRVNPIHEATEEYCSSKEEIDAVIDAGADILMLPYFKSVEEVQNFIKYVDGRTKTMLLLETPEAATVIDEILNISGIDEMFIGLNDLSLGYKKKFMFELLADGTVEQLCFKFKQAGIPYGFGGIAAIGTGMLPAEHIIREHYRLGSTCVILSRSFCDTNKEKREEVIQSIFSEGVHKIREVENECENCANYFNENLEVIKEKVALICKQRG